MTTVKSFRDRGSVHPTSAADLPKELERTFAGVRFEIDSRDVLHSDGNPVHGRTTLENLVRADDDFRIEVIFRPVRQQKAREDLERQVVPGSAELSSYGAIRSAIERLLYLEAKLPFVALSYFVGRHLNGQHELIRALKLQGVLCFGETQNPKNPDHRVTTISANRDHPLVQEVLRPIARREGEIELP